MVILLKGSVKSLFSCDNQIFTDDYNERTYSIKRNLFEPNVLFLYPLETPENLWLK